MQTVETTYVFRFASADRRQYARHVYWESLYAVSHGDGWLLVASRVVPVNDSLFALYASVRHAFLREVREPALLADPNAGRPQEQQDEDAAAGRPRAMPAERFPGMLTLALRESDDLPSAPIRKLAAEYSGVTPGTLPPAIQPYVSQPLPDAGARNEAPMPPVPMIPPALRRYLRTRYGRLGEIMARYEEEEGLDPRFHRLRIESLIGRAEARALDISEHYEAVILGVVVDGDLPINEADPQRSSSSYQVDPDGDLGGLVLREVAGLLQKAAARLRVSWSLHGNIRRIRFLDDV
jgi:hypothetical protein